MVLGVGILMNVISISGGIDIVVNSISNCDRTGTIMAIAAGLMSFFSSGLGVVFPIMRQPADLLRASAA